MPESESTPAQRPLDALEATIRERAAAVTQGGGPEKSWTAKLLAGNLSLVCGKVTEEAGELVEAAAGLELAGPGPEGAGPEVVNEARAHFIAEAGDLLYHTLVLLRREGVNLAEVEAELARRFGVSGIEEKERRGTTDEHG